jgi:hypothetical protein
MPGFNSFRATTAIKNNNQVPSGPVSLPYSVLSQILNGSSCRRSLVAYNLLGAGPQNKRVSNWNAKNNIVYNC